jgi:hypothetical protein
LSVFVGHTMSNV